MIIDIAGVSPEAVVERHMAHLSLDSIQRSRTIRGGQTKADAALDDFDVSGYAASRSQVLPEEDRGASRLSPYIRHGLLPLTHVWNGVTGPQKDVTKFRNELLWQEYSRHLYARIGTDLYSNLRFDVPWAGDLTATAWPRDMACIDFALSSLETEGWLVNQTRLWLASQYTVRSGGGWLAAQEHFHRHLLDGSRAANLLGWQWTVGAGTGKPYGFARWQVEKRAPSLCANCPLSRHCPIEDFPAASVPREVANPPARLAHDDTLSKTRGPSEVITRRTPDTVVLTVESLGDRDPALTAHPHLPVVFIFNEPALKKLQLSSKRLIFFVETLQDLAKRRDVTVYLDDPHAITPNLHAAMTWAPVPSFSTYGETAAELHPWPWLVEPHAASLASFSAWNRVIQRPN